MIGILGLTLSALAAVAPVRRAAPEAQATGEVTAVALVSSAGSADFTIRMRGDAQLQAFQLEAPNRLVLDLNGATLGRAIAPYDGQNRGGITNVRAAQFKAGVVRIVLELDAPKTYKVRRGTETITVSVATDRVFSAWQPATAAPARSFAQAYAPTDDADDVPLVRTSLGANADEAAFADEDEDAFEEPAAPVRATGLPAARKSSSVLEGGAFAAEPRITITFDKTSIADVVASFASYSGRSIILGKGITGEVSAEVKNQPWPAAFQAILSSQGLTAAELPGGIIRVDAPSVLAALDSTEPLANELVRINYASAGALVKTVESILTKNRGRVVADSVSNSLIITDTKSKLADVVAFVRGLDVRTPQLSIQAKIIFVDRTDVEQIGVKYDLGSRTQFFNRLIQRPDPLNPQNPQGIPPNINVIDLGGGQVAAIGNAEANISAPAIDLVFSTAIGGFSLTSFLQALQRAELSDVQAEPLISTLDNQQADILVGEETPIRIVDAASIGGQQAGVRATVQFKQTGIRLTVTPHVTNNRQILMTLATERSAIRPLAAAELGYVFDVQKATNKLLVNDGETAVIGGLTVSSVNKTRSGIPLLSNLPLVGGLFSFSNTEERRRDLIILVTPRIIDEGAVP
jgi:type IV pilus assembly protein PilQ